MQRISAICGASPTVAFAAEPRRRDPGAGAGRAVSEGFRASCGSDCDTGGRVCLARDRCVDAGRACQPGSAGVVRSSGARQSPASGEAAVPRPGGREGAEPSFEEPVLAVWMNMGGTVGPGKAA